MPQEPAEYLPARRDLARPGLWDMSLFGLCMALIVLSTWAHAEDRLSIFLGLPRSGPDVSRLLSELRSDFVRGVVSGGLLLLLFGLALLARSPTTRRGLIVAPLFMFGGDVLKALLIFWTCSSLVDESGIPGAWSARGAFTLHNVKLLAILLGVVGLAIWGALRERRSPTEARRKSVPNPYVEQLSLSGLPVADGRLEEIGRATMLRALWLCDTKVTDAGLEYLKNLNRLEELYLDNTPVTDAGLSSLARLAHLKRLSLRGTNVTEEGVARLKAALPQLEVRR